MVRTNPIPEGLRGRPFSEQVEALPAREALRAVLSEAPGFRDETPDPVTFATGLLPLAQNIAVIFPQPDSGLGYGNN